MIALFLLLAVFGLCLWGLYCNHKTFEDLMMVTRLTGQVPLNTDGLELFRKRCKMVDSVGYTMHMLARMGFYNPWKLYPQAIQDLVKGTNVS